jgi:hypothetical protein
MSQSTAKETNLDSTIDALSGNLTAIKPEAASDVITTWRRSLSQSSKPELKKISEDLGELKDALSKSKLDGKEIGGILSRLGTQTSACADGADADLSGKLSKLGSLLSKAGKSLS